MTTPRRILVVEDDDGLRETLIDVLRDERHEVRSASNGAEALEALDGWNADLVILDLMMPTMDGREFRERQLAEGDGSAPLLVVSAARDLDGAAEHLGASAWLAKPFVLHELIALVDDLLDRHTQRAHPA